MTLVVISETKESITDMKRLSESVWGDVRRRADGQAVRKEDDIDSKSLEEFYYYLTDIYNSTNFSALRYDKLNEYIGITLFVRRRTLYSLFVEKMPSGNIRVKFPGSFSRDEKRLTTLLRNQYRIEDNGFMFLVYPKDSDIVTNSFVIDVIDFVLDNVLDTYEKSITRK